MPNVCLDYCRHVHDRADSLGVIYSNLFKNFLQFAFEKSPSQSLSKTGMKLIPTSLLQSLKEYLWTQLTECRQIDVKKADDDLPHDYSSVDSPTAILDKLISSLEGITNDRINNLCETRRSAGLLPSIVAILITEPKQRNHSAFTKTLERMFAINSQDPGMIIHFSAVALIATTQEHEFVAICQWLCEKLETISKSNNAIDGCFLLLNLCLERHCGDIPEIIIGACQQLFQGLFDVIDIGSLADIPFYYLLTSGKYLASDENLQKLADAGIEMIQTDGKFENEKCLSFTGFAELLVFHQDLWKERKDKCSMKLRLECYNFATELDVEFLDQLYKDFGEVKSDEEISMVPKPLTLNHDYLDEEIFPAIDRLFSTHSPTSEIYFDW